MSDAGFHFRPRPASPVAESPQREPLGNKRRTDGGRIDRLGPAAGSSFDDEPHYPLDPPLVDVRIPVKPPHATATGYSREALMDRFPDAEVGDDLHMLFSEAGKAKQSRLSPDVLVALNVSRSPTRDDYDADRHGPPDFVLEVLSRSTWEHDVGRKLDCYQQIGVRECLLFDVKGEDRAGTGKELWGFALTPESRRPLEEVALPNGERGVYSAVLGLVAYVAERTPPREPKETWALTMRWHDPATGTDIPGYAQSRAETRAERARKEAAQREAGAERARRKAEQREKEAAQREAEAERTRREAAQREKEAAQREAGAERTRREAEQREKEAAQREAEAERAGREAALRRVAELEEQLRLLDEQGRSLP